MKNLMQFKDFHYQFKPSLLGIFLTLVCIPLFIKFGLWQYNKAQQKLEIQAAYHHEEVGGVRKFPLSDAKILLDTDWWKYKKITVTGTYETKFQFLLDNQVEGKRVGFHVITPLKINHTSQYVLVNRGWILGKDTHAELPTFPTPEGIQTLTGQIWVPSTKIFTLENEAIIDQSINNKTENWKPVWQHMNIAKYKKSVPFSVSEMVIKLDPTSNAGGFVRNWQVPAERITTHIGYAYQWFGFASATLLIFIYMSFTKVRVEINPSLDIR